MKVLFTALMLLVNMLALPAFASNAIIEQLDALVAQQDVAGVEKLIADIDTDPKTSQDDKNRDLRLIYAEFSTTHPQYIDLIARWQSDKPNSLYAKIAKGRHLIHIAWMLRGRRLYAQIFHVATKQMQEYFEQSSELAFSVVFTRPDFVPASDLAIEVSVHGGAVISLDQLISMVLAANPNMVTLDAALNLKAPKWYGSFDDIRDLCYTYIVILETDKQYSPGMCYAENYLLNIQFAKNSPLKQKRLDWAFHILDAAPSDKMVSARLADALYLRPQRKGAQELALKLTLEINEYSPDVIFWLEKQLGLDGVYDAYYSKRMKKFESILSRDPYNVLTLKYLADDAYAEYSDNLDPRTLQKYENYLDDALIYGKYRSELWTSKARVYSKINDTEAARKTISYLDKGAEYSNFSPGYLETYFARLKMFDDIAKQRISFDKLDNPIPPELEKINATKVQAVIKCPMVRIARLYSLKCEVNNDLTQCHGYDDGLSWSKVMLMQAKDEKICPKRLIEPEDNLFINSADWAQDM